MRVMRIFCGCNSMRDKSRCRVPRLEVIKESPIPMLHTAPIDSGSVLLLGFENISPHIVRSDSLVGLLYVAPKHLHTLLTNGPSYVLTTIYTKSEMEVSSRKLKRPILIVSHR